MISSCWMKFHEEIEDTHTHTRARIHLSDRLRWNSILGMPLRIQHITITFTSSPLFRTHTLFSMRRPSLLYDTENKRHCTHTHIAKSKDRLAIGFSLLRGNCQYVSINQLFHILTIWQFSRNTNTHTHTHTRYVKGQCTLLCTFRHIHRNISNSHSSEQRKLITYCWRNSIANRNIIAWWCGMISIHADTIYKANKCM